MQSISRPRIPGAAQACRRLLAMFWITVAASTVAAQPVTEGEAVLPAARGWHAFRIHKSDVGIWYAHIAKVVPFYGANEVIACDDRGRLTVLSVYSGKWTAHDVTCDGQWLAPSRPADVDPRCPGREIYVAGKSGTLHRVTLDQQPFARFELRSVEIGHVAAEEFHTVLAADLRPDHPGDELWAFAIQGRLFELSPRGASGDAFDTRQIATLPGRVRDALVIPDRPQAAPLVLAVARSGDLLGLRAHAGGVEQRVVTHESSGLGRIARRVPAPGEPEVVYVTRDDGVLLRLEARGNDWQREVIYVGSQGLRGVACGRFYADGREAVAVYGYGKRVQIVSRTGTDPWQVETVFGSDEQGHWLAVGELDGRNGTDELVATGFDGTVVLLTRPAGYALTNAAVERDD
ncbi:MAG: hypothetical protein R3F56_10410 [Planctomycetota bacterium]